MTLRLSFTGISRNKSNRIIDNGLLEVAPFHLSLLRFLRTDRSALLKKKKGRCLCAGNKRDKEQPNEDRFCATLLEGVASAVGLREAGGHRE